MRTRSGLILLGVALVALSLMALWTVNADSDPPTGSPLAQDFTFKDINPASSTHGDALTLSELYADGGVVLQFVASWCGPCREELPHLQELYAADRAPIVLVAADEYGFTEGILIVAERARLTTPLLFVPKEQAAALGQHYDHELLPTTYLIGEQGMILERHEGAWSKSRLVAAIERQLE